MAKNKIKQVKIKIVEFQQQQNYKLKMKILPEKMTDIIHKIDFKFPSKFFYETKSNDASSNQS
jgi:hypothetical protein